MKYTVNKEFEEVSFLIALIIFVFMVVMTFCCIKIIDILDPVEEDQDTQEEILIEDTAIVPKGSHKQNI